MAEKHRSRERNTAAGFTLLELMIVIAIIGILAVYGTPKYQGLQEQFRLENSAQMLIAELKYAKQLAMDQRRISWLVLNSERVRVMQEDISGNYQEIDSKPFGQTVRFAYDPVLDNWLQPIADAGGMLLGYGLSYDKRGFVSGPGRIRLESANQEVGVEIEDKTGYVSVVWP